MTSGLYKIERQQRGSQRTAALLGVHRVTIAKRETGRWPISTEAALAICALPLPTN